MRHLLAVLLVPVVFAALAPAAPVPKHLLKPPEPVYYYPTTVGAKWVYDGDHVRVVAKVEDRKGAKVVSVEAEAEGKRAADETMEVSETGLTRLACGGAPFDVPLVMLIGPIRVGTTWEIKTAGAQGTGRIGAVETVKVPAGSFEAVRVDIEQPHADRVRTIRAWYAPDIGLLKMTDDDKEIWLLKSFTSGK